jgi:hypothetical protein
VIAPGNEHEEMVREERRAFDVLEAYSILVATTDAVVLRLQTRVYPLPGTAPVRTVLQHSAFET